MKTTINIPDALFDEAKRLAAARHVSLREVLDAALSDYLKRERAAKAAFRLEDGTVGGRGVAPGIREGDWSHIRELIYEGRGG